MSDLFLYDDATARAFEPFALTRPTSELRAGAMLLRERWERAIGMSASGVVTSPHLSGFDEPWAPGARPVTGVIRAGSVLANARCAVALQPTPAGDAWRCAERTAAVVLDRDVEVAELVGDRPPSLDSLGRKSGGRVVPVDGTWIEHVTDLVSHLAALMTADIGALSAVASRTGAALGVVVGGAHSVAAEEGATVEPQVFFDVTHGPVLIRRGATVQAFSRIIGPCVIGSESEVGGDEIRVTSIGDVCKVHGEVGNSVFLGHCNKAHDGYVGSSYLGRWVNLGAGTTTSNLKNTYGNVRFWTPDGERDSGLQFLGTLFGDHVKTGIGTLLPTGAVIGAGANVYGGSLCPKTVAPFSWGDQPPYSTYRMDKFIEVARRVMARRHVELSDGQIRMLESAFERRWSVEDASA
jgi:UDP-N-acetylglucosamine diphosphorylase / glucose-1-phosphate thymidylyltransferase / UDP-N-acetylgalactosamine diphosphorylase / glucosamine-1-phosphate N-acetyltransferase / galactosamine-1-phosphate N-acetyltransferase